MEDDLFIEDNVIGYFSHQGIRTCLVSLDTRKSKISNDPKCISTGTTQCPLFPGNSSDNILHFTVTLTYMCHIDTVFLLHKGLCHLAKNSRFRLLSFLPFVVTAQISHFKCWTVCCSMLQNANVTFC